METLNKFIRKTVRMDLEHMWQYSLGARFVETKTEKWKLDITDVRWGHHALAGRPQSRCRPTDAAHTNHRIISPSPIQRQKQTDINKEEGTQWLIPKFSFATKRCSTCSITSINVQYKRYVGPHYNANCFLQKLGFPTRKKITLGVKKGEILH